MSLVSAKCPNCGASIQVDNERKEAFCSYCGSKVEVQEAIGKVKIDNSEELANLYQVARRAKEQNNSENAAKYYDMILIKDPNSWEANFYVVYYQAMQCKIAEISSAAMSVCKNVRPVLELVRKTINNKDWKSVIKEISIRTEALSTMLYDAAKSHYDGIDYSIKLNFMQDYVYNANATAVLLYTLGDAIIELFGEDFYIYATLAWKSGVKKHCSFANLLEDKAGSYACIDKYESKIRKYNTDYEAPRIKVTNSSGCYIATAVYGSYDCPEVWILRRFRDSTLAETWYGRTFIKAYYTISPNLVKWFGSTTLFKVFWIYIYWTSSSQDLSAMAMMILLI